ncbi:hypothetical protein AABB40_16030 [Bacillus velezensis]|uniref:hypothetical protein n=1 Tax=Bacillus velezensis TaxID=492670 RepID=UPI003159F4F1
MAETKKYVRIKKASVDGVWYADKIGSIFPSLGTWENVYKVDSPDRALYIRKEDAELIITENRRPKVDERVLITEVLLSSGDYKVGDICTVRSVVDIYGTITVKEHSNCVLAREYEVIVNNEVKNEEADRMKIDLNAMGFDELIAHGEDVIRAIRLRAYGEGYRQGKFDADMDAMYMQPQARAHKSVQERRDEIVEQAKADVEDLFKRDIGYRHDFIVNSEKRTVVALRKSFGEGYVRDRGIAKAAPDDCFNVHIGKAIALRRALGLSVPDEYLNAPQPTEVRVGDFIADDSGVHKALVIEDDSWPPFSGGAAIYLKDARKYGYRIIDDSREEVGGE